MNWWYAGEAQYRDNTFTWHDGTQVKIAQGMVGTIAPRGFVETKVHFGGMKWADPHPFVYPTVSVEPVNGRIVIEVISHPMKLSAY
jgi:hypothetical protein